MTLCRTIHNKNYTVVNNTIATDKRISYKAKGIWLYAFSRPDDWSFYVSDIVNQSTDGKDSIRSGLQELEDNGYLKRDRLRNDDGTFGDAFWEFHELPQFTSENPSTPSFKPKAENPTLDNPKQDNPPLLSTDFKPSTEARESKTKAAPDVCVISFGSHVRLKKAAHEKLIVQYGESLITEMIEVVNDYCAATRPKGYDDYAAAIRNFIRRSKDSSKGKQNKTTANDKIPAAPMNDLQKRLASGGIECGEDQYRLILAKSQKEKNPDYAKGYRYLNGAGKWVTT